MILLHLPLFILFSSSCALTPGDASARAAAGNKSLLIVGMGGVGRVLAEQATDHFDVIFGTRREVGVVPVQDTVDTPKKILDIPFDASAVESCLASCCCRHILVTTPPLLCNNPDTTDSVPSEMLPFAQIMQQHLISSEQCPAWVGVLSTTGVYGDHKGEWVTETSPCYCPESSNANAYLQWERAWKDFGQVNSCRVRVFRCAGIYGASRSSLHTIYKKGIEEQVDSLSTALDGPSTLPSLTNRIHESDLVAAVLASMLQDEMSSTASDFEVYNLADNLPESREVVFAYARDLFAPHGIEIPVRANPATKTKRSVRRSRENKRVCNRKMREHLLPQLEFPSYKEGLEDILQQPDVPWFLPRKIGT